MTTKLKELVAVHPLLFVTITEYVPAVPVLYVGELAPAIDVPLIDHE